MDSKEQSKSKAIVIDELVRKTCEIARKISLMRLKNLDVVLEVHGGDVFSVVVTIYSKVTNSNVFFTAYDFYTTKANNDVLDKALELANGDDYSEVAKYSPAV